MLEIAPDPHLGTQVKNIRTGIVGVIVRITHYTHSAPFVAVQREGRNEWGRPYPIIECDVDDLEVYL